MKRIILMFLNYTGIILSFVMVGTGVVFLYLTRSERFKQYLESGWTESQNAYTMEQLSQADTMFIWPGLIGLILGILAVRLLKINSNPRIVAWGLIVVSVIICFISLFAAIPGICYIAAGIWILALKVR